MRSALQSSLEELLASETDRMGGVWKCYAANKCNIAVGPGTFVSGQ